MGKISSTLKVKQSILMRVLDIMVEFETKFNSFPKLMTQQKPNLSNLFEFCVRLVHLKRIIRLEKLKILSKMRLTLFFSFFEVGDRRTGKLV